VVNRIDYSLQWGILFSAGRYRVLLIKPVLSVQHSWSTPKRFKMVCTTRYRDVSTLWAKKWCHPNHGRNFVNSWAIYKILSLLRRALNFKQNAY